MASLRVRRRRDGSPAYAVLFRERTSGKQTSLTFTDRTEAERLMRILEANGGDLKGASEVIAAIKRKVPLVEDVLAEHVDLLTGVSEGSKLNYRRQIRDHLSGRISSLTIENVGPRDVVQLIQELQRKGLGPKTIRNIHGLLSGAFKTAVRLEYRKSNPCEGISLPRSHATTDEMRLLNHAQAAILLDSLAPESRPLIRFLLGTGLRWGEATALTVGDVDLDGPTPTVRVTKAWKRDPDGRRSIGPPKTDRSRRTVSLPNSVADDLRVLTEDRPDEAFLFTNRTGGPVQQATFWTNDWSTAIKRAQDPERFGGTGQPVLTITPRIHDLRHTHASWLIAEGTDMVVVQRRLGHESITTTVDRYSHLLPEQHAKAADAATRALRGL